VTPELRHLAGEAGSADFVRKAAALLRMFLTSTGGTTHTTTRSRVTAVGERIDDGGHVADEFVGRFTVTAFVDCHRCVAAERGTTTVVHLPMNI